MILFAKTFALVHENVNQYNTNRPSDERLKANHKTLLQALIRLLESQNRTEQAKELRISTNSKHLAELVGCCSRSIRNLLSRLEAANFITKYWRGTHTNFYITINAKLLKLAEPFKYLLNPEQQKEEKTNHLLELAGIEKPTTQAPKRKNLPLRESSNYIKQPNKAVYNSIELYGCKFIKVETLSGNSQRQVKKSENQTSLSTDQQKNKKNIAAAAEKERQTVKNALNYAQRAWAYAYEAVFLNPANDLTYISDTEKLCGQAFLLKIFYNSKNMRLTYHEVITRLELAKKYIEKSDKYTKRFIPIPSVYFDLANKNGFAGTKIWFERLNDQKKYANEVSKLQFDRERATKNLMNGIMRKYISNGANLLSYNQALATLHKKGADQLKPIFLEFAANYSSIN